MGMRVFERFCGKANLGKRDIGVETYFRSGFRYLAHLSVPPILAEAVVMPPTRLVETDTPILTGVSQLLQAFAGGQFSALKTLMEG